MSRARRVLALLAALGAGACSGSKAPAPRAQWVVVVATDAPVPAFGQQLALELIDDQGDPISPDARRLFDGSQPSQWPVSFGVVPSSPGETPRIHAQLYRLDEVGVTASPVGTAFIDATARLPPTSGVTTVALTLSMNCFGVPPDLAGQMTCDPSMSALAPEPTLPYGPDLGSLPAAGSWQPAQSVNCRGNVPPGMVCIPGGAFLLGSWRYAPQASGDDPFPPHLVQLSPFAIDMDEVTVGQFRALVVAGKLPPPPAGDFANIDSDSGPCTWVSASDPSHDAYPINCVSWQASHDACQLLGKRLPTEAEWEYTAGNLSAKTQFPWGSDPDYCSHSIVARGRPDSMMEDTTCLLTPNGQLLPTGTIPGGAPDDVTQLGVRNLGGNLSEWLEDDYLPYTAPCWEQGTLLVDPQCTGDSMGLHSLRGGCWNGFGVQANVTLRNGAIIMLTTNTMSTGFRCALPM